MNERRIKRLEAQIKARVAQVIAHELADPRRGLITVTRVQLDREVAHCKIFWSVLGGQKERALNERMLSHATKFVRGEVAGVLHTRTVPQVHFVFDESIEGALRVEGIIARLRAEREARETEETAECEPDRPADDPPGASGSAD